VPKKIFSGKTSSKKPDFPIFSAFVKNRPIPVPIPKPGSALVMDLDLLYGVHGDLLPMTILGYN